MCYIFINNIVNSKINLYLLANFYKNTVKSYFLFFITGIFFILQSCESKQSFMSKFDVFVTETSTNYTNYSGTDWAKADTTFAQFEKDCLYKWDKDLTADENARINELKGKYLAIKVKAGLIDLKNGLNDLLEQSESFVKELGLDSTLNK